MFVSRACLRTCLVRGSIDMLGWTVDRVEAQRFGAGADHVVTSALRHDHPVVGSNLVAHAVDPDFTFAAFDAEELVTVIVNFLADLITGLDRHQDQLKIVAGVKHPAEIAVFLGQFLNVVDELLHYS